MTVEVSQDDREKAIEFVTAWRNDDNGLRFPDSEWGMWLAQAIDVLLELAGRPGGAPVTELALFEQTANLNIHAQPVQPYRLTKERK